MEEVMAIFLVLCYKLAIILVTCYMTVNHGWGWIFLLLFACMGLKSDNDTKESEKNNNDGQ